MQKYKIQCLKCKKFVKEEFLSKCCENSLVRTVYNKKLKIKSENTIWKFLDWFPIKNKTNYDSTPIVYKSDGLAKELNLKNLYIAFSGYWKERNAKMLTCTFKELEAPLTIQRAREFNLPSLVVASAGNTGRAFSYIGNKEKFPIILFVNNFAKNQIFSTEENILTKTILVKGDYTNSINLAKKFSYLNNYNYEGGFLNIGRRDALGIILLETFFKIKKIPKHYFQAIGSGTGAIATHETSLRLIKYFNGNIPKLHLSQNFPFVPMVNAWKERKRKIEVKENAIEKIYAKVLSNREPGYSIFGGVYDCLKESRGLVYSIKNSEAKYSENLFYKKEGIDIVPASSICVASLIKAIEENKVKKEDIILLNITGGGEKQLKRDYKIYKIKINETIDKNIKEKELKELLWNKKSSKY